MGKEKKGKKGAVPVEIVNPDTREKVTLLFSKENFEFLQALSNACRIPPSRLCDIAMRRFRKELAGKLGTDLMAMKPEEHPLDINISRAMYEFSDEDHKLWEEEQKHKE